MAAGPANRDQAGERLTTEISTRISASGNRLNLQGTGLLQAIGVGLEGTSRTIAASDDPALFGVEFAIGQADVTASDRLVDVTNAMTEAPSPSSPIDAETRDLLTTTPAELRRLSAEQNRHVDLAAGYGARGDRATLALSVLAVAAVLLALAAVLGRGRAGRMALLVGAVMVAGTVALGAWSLVP